MKEDLGELYGQTFFSIILFLPLSLVFAFSLASKQRANSTCWFRAWVKGIRSPNHTSDDQNDRHSEERIQCFERPQSGGRRHHASTLTNPLEKWEDRNCHE
jgi:hypothetical protein